MMKTTMAKMAATRTTATGTPMMMDHGFTGMVCTPGGGGSGGDGSGGGCGGGVGLGILWLSIPADVLPLSPTRARTH